MAVGRGRYRKGLFEIAQWDGAPEIVGKMADEKFVDEVDGPDDPVDEQEDPVVVVVPTDHQGVETQDEIDDAGISAVHGANINKKEARGLFFRYEGYVISVWLPRRPPRRRL
jgi:hypothetical protein